MATRVDQAAYIGSSRQLPTNKDTRHHMGASKQQFSPQKMDDTCHGHNHLYKNRLAPSLTPEIASPVCPPSPSSLMPTARTLSIVRSSPRLTTRPSVLKARTLGAPIPDPKSYPNTLYTNARSRGNDLRTHLVRLFQQRSMGKPELS